MGILRSVGVALFVLGLMLRGSTCYSQSTPAVSPPVKEWPKEYRGVWYLAKSCDEVNGQMAIYDKFRIYSVYNSDVALNVKIFDNSEIRSVEPTQVAVKDVTSLQNRWQESTSYMKIVDGLLAYENYTPRGEQQNTIKYLRCDNPTRKSQPIVVYEMFYRDLNNMLGNYLALSERCNSLSGSTKECVKFIFQLLDANGDGKISPAEITKFLRDLSKFSLLLNGERPASLVPTMYKVEFTLDAVRASQAASVIIGPWISSIVMSNLDYDANGVITPDELALTLGSGSSGSTADITRAFEKAKDQLTGIMPAVTGLTQLLGIGSAAHK